MRFYYYNCESTGYFTEKNLVKAIYTAWNIEADLYLLNDGLKKIDSSYPKCCQLIFSPLDDNEFNSAILHKFGYYMTDGEKYREIRRLDNDKEEKYDWSEVKQLR